MTLRPRLSITLIWIPLLLSSCAGDGVFSVNTGFDFSATSIQLTFSSNNFSETSEADIKLYYMHELEDTTDILAEFADYKYRFNLEIYEYGGNNEPLIVFDRNLTVFEFYQAENYGGQTSDCWLFAKPIYNSFFEVKYSFSTDNLKEGRIFYNLFTIDEKETQTLSLTAECRYEVVNSSVHLSR